MIQEIKIQSEPIGSLPRTIQLINAQKHFIDGLINEKELSLVYDESIKDTIEQYTKIGAEIITDGEMMKPSFLTYPVSGSPQIDCFSCCGVEVSFRDGHTRHIPTLAINMQPPFKYKTYAKDYIINARKFTNLPIKQAVISVSAMSLLYPQNNVQNYTRDQYIKDMLDEVEKDIRLCFENNVYCVQIDATEARLSLKLDPSGELLKQFIELNRQLLTRFNEKELQKIGIHSCPGADQNSTHSLEVDYTRLLLPALFSLPVGRLYLEFAAEPNKIEIIKCVNKHIRPNQIVFFGVIDVLDPIVETPEKVRDLILQIHQYLPNIHQIGTTDDCGFSPFGDDLTRSREVAFAKIQSRILGTKMAENILNQQLNNDN